MSWRLIIRPDVDDDIESIADYLEIVRTGLGLRFVEQLESLLARIETHPLIYAIRKRDVRVARIPKSPYLLSYFVADQRIEVIAVTHGARHEPSWLSRR